MIKTLLKICLQAAYVLCLGEVFVRIFSPEAIMPRYVTGAEYGVRTNIAGARYWHVTPDVKVEYRINQSGFRSDVEYSTRKPAGLCRVVMLGDSFMMGYEVNVEDSIPYVLQNLLASANQPCEVINMAVSGFGTAEMLVALEARALSYEPDVIVFQWHRTDYQDNVRSALYKLNDGKLQRSRANYLPSIAVQDFLQEIAVYRFVIQHSQLYSAIRDTLAVQVKRALAQIRRRDAIEDEAEENAQEPAEVAMHPRAPTAGVSYEAMLSAELLQKAADLAEANRARFYLLDIPEKVNDNAGLTRTTLTRMDRQQLGNIAVVRLDSELNELIKQNVQVFYENGQGHFTPLGYRIAAMELFEAIIQDIEAADPPATLGN